MSLESIQKIELALLQTSITISCNRALDSTFVLILSSVGIGQ